MKITIDTIERGITVEDEDGAENHEMGSEQQTIRLVAEKLIPIKDTQRLVIVEDVG